MRRWLPLPLLLLLVASCAAPRSAEDNKRVVRITGSEALTHRLLPALAATYQQNRPHVELRIETSSESEGIRALLDGRVQAAASTRPARHSEEEQAKELGFKLNHPDARHIVAVDMVAVSVHASNPTDSLTYDQIIGIFCTRSIDNWSFLGLDDIPIRVLSRDASSGTRALFEDFFCGPKGIHHRAEVVDVEDMARIVKEDPGAITFISMTENVGKVLGLRPDASGPPVRPSQQNIIRGSYPLYHDLYLFTQGTPASDTRAFIEWISSPGGQEVVDEQRFVPLFLRPQRLDDTRPLRETIHFEPGEAAPNQRSAARLQLLVDELRDRAGEYRHVVLEGFTDVQEPLPLELSKARAEAVRDLLQDELPALYFEIIPRGARDPIAPNDTPYGRQRNRRVQIYLAAEEKREEVVVEGAG